MLDGGAPAAIVRAPEAGESNLQRAAGVWLRQFDGMSDEATDRPWLPCAQGTSAWCAQFYDRWPATIVSARHPGSWSPSRGGLILEGGLLSLRCGYSGDGSSMGKGCADSVDSSHCIPGCQTANFRSWCAPFGGACVTDCAWHPGQLAELLRQQDSCNVWGHNELVLDPQALVARLPASVKAFFYMAGSPPEQQQQARRAHAEFVRSYPSSLTSGVVPLVVYNPRAVSHPAAGREPAFALGAPGPAEQRPPSRVV